MAPTPTAELRTSLGQHSYVSIGLVVALVTGAMFYGRQLERLDAIESQVRELRTEVRESRAELLEIRTVLVRQQSPGR